jgi:hypothetical protein
MKRARGAAWSCVPIAGLVLAIGCDDGMPANSGLTEPFLVHGGQFVSGPLPGAPPVDGGLVLPSNDGGADGGAAPKLPPLTVTNVGFLNPLVLPGIAGKSISGRATSDTAAIGVKLEGLGSGYWVVPIADPDPDFPGQDDFTFSADFSANNPPGRRQLLTVAIDANGNAGTQVETPMCLEQRIPDNLHECQKTNPVPRAVFTLQWDTNFDLDLHVILPDGRDVNPKAPVTMPFDAGMLPLTDGRIDRDSLRACVPDGLRQEDLIFPAYPARGNYQLYVNPFDSCGQASVRFNMIVSEPGADGNLHPTFTRSGELLQMQQTGGGSRGLFVFEKKFD